MVATSTAIDATYLAWRNADKPTMIGRNLLKDCDSGFPIARADGSFTGADASDADYPVTNLYDDCRRTTWKLGAASVDVFILAKYTAGKSANCLIIEGAGGLMDGDSVRVRVSDTVDGGGLLNGVVLTPLDDTGRDGRMVFLFDETVTGIYWEIRVLGALATYEGVQVWLGLQTQLPHKSRVPYDVARKFGSWQDSTAKSGSRTRVQFFGGLFRREFSLWLRNSTIVGLIRTLYDDSDEFSSPVWFVENPYSDPHDSAIFGYMDAPDLDLPSQIEDDVLWDNGISEEGPLVD